MLFFVGAAATAVVAGVQACSSFEEDAVVAPDAAIDANEGGMVRDAAAPVDGAPILDAAREIDAADASKSAPGTIDCFGVTCDLNVNQHCCYERATAADGGPPVCAKTCGFGALIATCDEKRDCAPGEACCVLGAYNVGCSNSCGNNERLCRVDDDCLPGSSCIYVPCRGTMLGICGPLGPSIGAFCNP